MNEILMRICARTPTYFHVTFTGFAILSQFFLFFFSPEPRILDELFIIPRSLLDTQTKMGDVQIHDERSKHRDRLAMLCVFIAIKQRFPDALLSGAEERMKGGILRSPPPPVRRLRRGSILLSSACFL